MGPGYPNGATGYSALNVYITGLGHGLTGYATFPTLLRPTPAAVSQDGVVVDEGSVGNGQETLSREVAYWFGLPVSGCGQFPDFLAFSGWQLTALLFNTTKETRAPAFTPTELSYMQARYSQSAAVPNG